MVQFTCTVNGKVHGPLGPDLVMATVNLIAKGLYLDASKNDLKPHPPANQGHAASRADIEDAEELQVSQAVKELRGEYILFLAGALPGLSHLRQSELNQENLLNSSKNKSIEY